MPQSALHPMTAFNAPTSFCTTYYKKRSCKLIDMVRNSNGVSDVAHIEAHFLGSRRKDTKLFKVDASLWTRKLQRFHWYVTQNKNGKCYIATGDYQHPSFIHRMVYELVHGAGSIPKDLIVDHKKGDSMDNRACALQLATRSENGFNRDKPRKFDALGREVNPTSKYSGVSVQEHTLKDGRKRKRFVAEFKMKGMKNKKTKSFACHIYGDEEAERQAARWRDEMLKQHVRPECRRLNGV